MPRILKHILGLLGGLVGLVVVALLILSLVGASASKRTYEVDENTLLAAVAANGDTFERGAHLVEILGCTDCHGENLAGHVIMDAPPFRVVGSNLTPGRGGVGGYNSPRDWDRAIRHGVLPDGRAVHPVMPSQVYHPLSDADAEALIAHLMSLDPVDSELPSTELRFIGKILAALPVLDYAAAVAEPGRTREPAPRASYLQPP